MQLRRGSSISGYRLTAPLGQGGMGVVWSAQSEQGATVAVKFLRSTDEVKMRLRLQREVEILSRLSSPFVARLLGHGIDPQAGPFLVSELIEGETLDERLRSGAIDNALIELLVDHALRGLDHAHGLGVIHRDIKPSNLMITADAHGATLVKMLDFGVSKLVGVSEAEALTSMSATVGTAAFMAPEQGVSSRNVTPRADLYSVGAILFYALTGRLPHRGRSPLIVMTLKSEYDAPRLGEVRPVGWPRALEDFVARLLARDPADRYSAAREARAAWQEAAAALREMAPVSSPFYVGGAPSPTVG